MSLFDNASIVPDQVPPESDDDDDDLGYPRAGIVKGSSDLVTDFVDTVSSIGKGMSKRTAGISEALHNGTGRVYHAITDNNRIVKFRIGLDGRLFLDRTINSIYVQTDKVGQARDRIVNAGKLVPQRAAKRMRHVITGDPNKRIRDHMKEVPQVKKMDKFSFMLGVAAIVFTEYLIFRHPEWFARFYSIFMLTLFTWRFIAYSGQKMQYFLLDFCYVVNFSCMLQTNFFQDNINFFRMNYALSMGPLCIAIILWNNSLVFHSLDKLTSFFLHAFPPMLCHLYRWQLIPVESMSVDDEMDLSVLYGPCLGVYVTWQIGYLYLTEVFFRTHLDSDPELQTSLRYLSTAYKTPVNQLVHFVCRNFGIIAKDDNLHPDRFLTKVVFCVSQLIYMALLMAPSYFFYTRYRLSVAYLVTVFLVAAWNGASYYIEVFSKRYNLKFEKIAASNGPASPVTKSSNNKQPAASSSSSEALPALNDDEEEVYVEALEDLNESQTHQLMEILKGLETNENDSEESIEVIEKMED